MFAAIIFPPEDEIIYLFRKLESKKTILEEFKSPYKKHLLLLKAYQYRAVLEHRVAVPALPHVGLGAEAVGLVLLKELIAHPHHIANNPRPWGGRGVKSELQPGHLGEPAFELGELGHAILQDGQEDRACNWKIEGYKKKVAFEEKKKWPSKKNGLRKKKTAFELGELGNAVLQDGQEN